MPDSRRRRRRARRIWLRPRKSRRRGPRGPTRFGAAAFRALVESGDDGMILADDTGIILFANPAAERLLGFSPADLVGRLGFDMCRAEDLPLARDAFARCLGHPDQVVPLRVAVNHADGGVRQLAVRLLNRLADPGVGAVVVHFREAGDDDVDRHEEEHYRAVFESAPIGLGVADLEGRLLVFNNAMMQPGGYTRADILAIGNVAKLYFHAADRDRVLGIAREQGFVWRHEVPFRRKDGSSYDSLLSLAPVQFAGRPCWLAAVEDITEQKRAEEQQRRLEAQLRQAQKMEAVGRMTAGIAHDFNNMLTVMLGSAQVLADTLGRDAGEQEELATLRAAGERGAGMVTKLLGFSRQTELRIEPTDLAALVQDLGGMVRHLVPQHISIGTSSEPGSRATVDPSAVEQMVLNLVTNARDAMPRNGTLHIDVRPVVVQETEVPGSWMTPGAFVRLSVTDTGVGMDEATRARIFEPFFTTKPAGVGTGLGLPMVYGLAKQQRGFVDVRSAPGQGTTVSLYFPRDPSVTLSPSQDSGL